MGGASISGLENGLMVQRTSNHKDTVYQTVRMCFLKMCDFIWPFEGVHPVDVRFDHEWRVRDGIVWVDFGTNASWGYANLIASA